MRLREATPDELSTWDELVRRFPDHRVTHLRAWAESLAASGLGDPLFLVFEQDGDVVGCLPGLVVRVAGWRLFGSPLPGWQTASMGPAFDPARLDTATMLDLLVPHLTAHHGVCHVEMMHPALDADAMRARGFRGERVFTYRAALDPDDTDRAFGRLKASARQNVRRAERLGLDVRFGVDDRFVAEHYDQLREVYRRRGNEIPFSEKRLAEGIRRMVDAGRLVAVSTYLPGSDVRIATGTFFVEGDELSLWNWAHRTHYRWYRATELMTWRVMERAMTLGCRTFDLMGHGEFKVKFGAVPDESRWRWMRSASRWLVAGRSLAHAAFRTQQVVRGRAHRAADGLARLTGRPSDAVIEPPRACVLGDIDLVRALGLRGIRSSVVAPPDAAARFSRHTREALPWTDPWDQPEALVDSLMRYAEAQPEPPVLFFQDDASLLLVSRHRERLSRAFRFVVAPPDLVEDLVDKSRFQDLARRLDLPVPRAQALEPAMGDTPADVFVDPPFILKPLTRRPARWAPLAGDRKALLVDSPRMLHALWPLIVRTGLPLLAQELVPGPETGIESYHVYVDADGHRVADFTGRKIRTFPEAFGDSSALEISAAPELLELGRDLTERLGLRGVAKFDFKRHPDGRFALLEVNARFTLWHHPAARAGMNIPAMVYDDLVGNSRGRDVSPARAGVRWCKLWTDHLAARASGIPFHRWLGWALRCEAKRAIAWSDPLPLVASGFRTWIARASAVALIALGAIGCDSSISAPPPPPIAPVTLVGAGDIAVCDRQADEATAAVTDSVGGFVFAAGDDLHDTSSAATYDGCYGPSWGRFRSRTFPAIGNHDYDYDAGARYFEYFGTRAGLAGLGYYSADVGAWHLVVLNSNSSKVPTAAGSEQEQWLRADLDAASARCTIALWHHPRFYQGTFNRNGAVRPFWAALVEARADVVLNGHFHLYERYAPQGPDGAPDARGPRQFTVGTGGRTLDALVEEAPNVEFRQADSYGVLKLTLGDGWYEWEYITVDRRIVDAGRASCH